MSLIEHVDKLEKALKAASGRLAATAEYIDRDTPPNNDPLYANAVRVWSRDVTNALASIVPLRKALK